MHHMHVIMYKNAASGITNMVNTGSRIKFIKNKPEYMSYISPFAYKHTRIRIYEKRIRVLGDECRC